MARPIRIQYSGAVYHVMARGNHGDPIFKDDQDRRCFLDTLAEACGRTGWHIHAYVLMGNHYHLLVETPEPNLVTGMKWLQGAYTQRYNRRHRKRGHLFQGRYKAVVVDGRETNYFQVVSTYIVPKRWCWPGRPIWDLLNDGIGNPKNTKSLLFAHQTPPAMSLGVRETTETAVRAGLKHILFAKIMAHGSLPA